MFAKIADFANLNIK